MNDVKREYHEIRECRSCGNDRMVFVQELIAPRVVNPGTEWEWIQTERVSKCAVCYL